MEKIEKKSKTTTTKRQKGANVLEGDHGW
jgi:hypothetical protein